ncbi:hypothetical protein BASA62_010141 [Batrachochytrium salamandrivorans]|nr:hypothetical protein BASA62_010141 [Batrachochytrium salamandrivorans]
MIGSLVVMARLDEASQTPLQFLFNSALATKRGSSQQNPHKSARRSQREKSLFWSTRLSGNARDVIKLITILAHAIVQTSEQQ